MHEFHITADNQRYDFHGADRAEVAKEALAKMPAGLRKFMLWQWSELESGGSVLDGTWPINRRALKAMADGK